MIGGLPILPHRRTLVPHGPVVAHRPVLPVLPVLPLGPILSVLIAVAEARLVIAPERTVAALMIAVLIPRLAAALEPATLARLALRYRLLLRLRGELHDMRLLAAAVETLVENIRVLVFGEIVGAVAVLLMWTLPVHPITMRRELLAIRHDDAIVMLRVLQIVLCEHMIAG